MNISSLDRLSNKIYTKPKIKVTKGIILIVQTDFLFISNDLHPRKLDKQNFVHIILKIIVKLY